MTEFISKTFPNEETVRKYYEKGLLSNLHFATAADATAFLKRRQRELYTQLFEDWNNTALYLPKVIAHKVAGKLQRRVNHLVHIRTETILKKDYLIDLRRHVPPFVFDAVGTLQSSGILKRIFDFVSSTSKPPPT